MSGTAGAAVLETTQGKVEKEFRPQPMIARMGPPDPHSGLILEHLDLVRVIAKQMLAALPKCVELDDLVQAGTLGLMDAARKFDPSKDVTFSTYAKHRIRGAILDSLRQQDPISRDLRRNQKKIEAAAAELEQQLKRAPGEPEIASYLNIDLKQLRMIHVSLQGSEQVSGSRPWNDELPAPEYADSPEKRPDALCARTMLRHEVNKALACIPERQQELLRLYYIEEMTMKEIGARMRINESRVSQIHKAAIHSVGERLRALGIESAAA